MAQNPAEQEAIVQRMIDAGEDEENIATVIRSFKTSPTPEPETTPEPVVDTPVVPEDKGWLRKGWDAISEPITDLPSRFARQVSDYIDQPVSRDDTYLSGVLARGKGFVAGATEGIGDAVSGLTSPLNLATAIASGGSSLAASAKLPTIAKGIGSVAKIAGGLTALHGGTEVLNPNATMGERGMGLMEIAGGIAGMHTPEVIPDKLPPITKTIIPEGQAVDPVSAVRGAMTEAAANEPKYKMGTIAVIKATKATPEIVKKARSQGFEFEGINDQGDFRFKKTTEPTAQPILESEVGDTRPTAAGIKKDQLGPITDKAKNSPVAEAFNLPRALMASMDFSAPLRQGLGLIHKKEFWNALGPMFKSAFSEDAFKAVQQQIAERPLFKERIGPKTARYPEGKILPSFADDAGLKLTDLTDMTTREEAIMSTWAERIPGLGKGVRGSNRAYTAFLNKLRADTFESLVKDGEVFGAGSQTNKVLARELADFVNTATGRGSLGKLEQHATALNTMFFSPRLMASRLQMLDPRRYIYANPQVRKESLKSLLAITTAGNVVTQLGKMAGGTVSMDPSNSDFGKLRVGNTRIDPFGGFQQYIVAANRLLNPVTKDTPVLGDIPGINRGQTLTSSTSDKEYDLWNNKPGPFDPNWGSVAGRFALGKSNPLISFAWGLVNGKKEMTGEKMDLTTMNPMENAIAQRFIPIMLQDLYELSQADELPAEVKALIAAGTSLGMGSQTYGPNPN